MHVNYRYLVHFADRDRAQSGKSSDAYTVLDYGCGAGEVVEAGREQGLSFFGADVFYAGGSTRHTIEEKGLLGTLVKEINDGKLDFPDAFFDLVVDNQVFEHVENLDRVVGEIHRVLKPGGKVLSIFPSRDMVREAHCGIPFLHWFSKTSKLRYPYAYTLRKIGFGFHKDERSTSEWTAYYLNWVDNYCFYRSRAAIRTSFGRYFSTRFIEDDYIAFRLRDSRLRPLAPLSQLPLLKSAGNEFLRRFGFLVILSEKR
jgi:SAM-dependent methyltransferase